MTAAGCGVCRGGRLVDALDFGPQPLCNRFLRRRDEPEYRHPLVVGQCDTCGLIQIEQPVPPIEMRSRFDWLVYGEPEDHLDSLADAIRALPGITTDSVVCGLSSVDESLLARLCGRGLARQWRLDLREDFGVDVVPPGVETIQMLLDSTKARVIAERRGRPDIIIGRYILEHAHAARGFLDALQAFLAPGGYLVLEVPDCSTALDGSDYSAVWEEHVLYFMASTFKKSQELAGYTVVRRESYPYQLQNALVTIATPGGQPGRTAHAADVLNDERARWHKWARALTQRRRAVQGFLAGYRAAGRGIAVLGAAQRACSFVNLLQLQEYIDVIVDDHPRKQGMFMPGSRTPIRPTSALLEEGRGLCLIAARPESQQRLMGAHSAFTDRGGEFLSIYPTGNPALPV